MNPVKLIFKHGGETLVSPIGLRFVEDPDHGPLVLIPELPQPKAYALAMTTEEASKAFCDAASMQPLSNFAAARLEEFEKKLELLGRKVYADGDDFENTKAGWELHEKALVSLRSRYACLLEQLGIKPGDENLVEPDFPTLSNLARDLESARRSVEHLTSLQRIDYARWQALQIHLGLPEGWEHFCEGAAEVKGALVSQAELLDILETKVNANHSTLTFNISLHQEQIDALRDDYNKLDYSLVDLARWCGSLEQRTAVPDSAPFRPEDSSTTFPLLQTCVQRQAGEPKKTVVGPITIAWSSEGPINAHTGKLIGASEWPSPEVMKRHAEGQLEEPKKSAWKPLVEAPKGGDLLVRYNTKNEREFIREITWGNGNSRWYFQDTGKALTNLDGYEFCPIPE